MRKRTRCIWLLILLSLLVPISAFSELSVHFIDVGQGDAILIHCDDKYLLLDAGPLEAGRVVNTYLRETLGVTQLDTVIASHEHDDHLLGMPDALSGFRVNKIYTPPAVPMSWWFEHVLPGLNQTELQIQRPESGEKIVLGSAELTFLETMKESEVANNLCLVLRVDYGKNSVLLTADLEGDGESYLLEKQEKLQADVLKIGHHGGNTSTTDAFLKAVNPEYAVISVGKGNKHGHPHAETLNKLIKRNIKTFRTDEFGTIVLTSDGQNWTVEVGKAK